MNEKLADQRFYNDAKDKATKEEVDRLFGQQTIKEEQFQPGPY